MRPCLDCNRVATKGSRCTACEARRNAVRDAARGNSTQRGLGSQHQAQVRALKAEAGEIPRCPRCQRAISQRNPLTGEHSIPRAHGGTGVDALVCRSCNASMGARIRRSDGPQ